jgi:hypothetical protein
MFDSDSMKELKIEIHDTIQSYKESFLQHSFQHYIQLDDISNVI